MTKLKTILALAGLGLSTGFVLSMSQPVESAGFNRLPGNPELSIQQYDFRIRTDFDDASANDNTTPHVNFPSATGSLMALWKAAIEWGSGAYGGTGAGDSTQGSLGSGLANFDPHYEGEVFVSGGLNDNIMSPLHQNGGSVFAFMEPGFTIEDGWRIRFYDNNWTWADGPGNVTGSHADLQGIGAHEYGHALGLDHSGNGQATMKTFGSLSDEQQRSIHSDDIAGVQAIYGAKDGNVKPKIESLAGSTNKGETLVINGKNYASTVNIWFTKESSDGEASKVFTVATSGGGTTVSVTVPNDAADGEVMVKNNGASGGASLSNGFPIDIDSSPMGGGEFVDIGPGIGGALGVPVQTGSGDLTPGSATGFEIEVSNCQPNAFGIWYWAFGGGGAVPFKGGTFYPVPILFSFVVFTDGSGGFTVPIAWDNTIPGGISFTTQYWCQDLTAPKNAAGTNGLRQDLPL